ncbi:MAG TPA: hypothetical protein ENN72_03480 [Firmicutes bacterium]|nr:hypothetical protein [Bacillota bacterium]
MTYLFLIISNVLLLIILVVLIFHRKKEPPVPFTAYRAPTRGEERILRHAVDLRLSAGRAWKLFASPSGGFKPFLSPLADIQYPLSGIQGPLSEKTPVDSPDHLLFEITGYLPGEIIVMRILNTPLGFPHPEIAKRLIVFLQLIPISSQKTRIVYSMAGWRDGDVWNDFYDFFDYTNQLILKRITEKIPLLDN